MGYSHLFPGLKFILNYGYVSTMTNHSDVPSILSLNNLILLILTGAGDFGSTFAPFSNIRALVFLVCCHPLGLFHLRTQMALGVTQQNSIALTVQLVLLFLSLSSIFQSLSSYFYLSPATINKLTFFFHFLP